MTEQIESEEIINSKIKKYFITNIIFGQKLINNLSNDNNKNGNINYFMNHLRNFQKQLEENWPNKINFDKYYDAIPQNIQEKLKDESDIIVKNKNYYIEPYCKRPLRIMTPFHIFRKVGFHYKLIKLESSYYDLFGVLYCGDKISGYICCGKKNSTSYKNLYVVINRKYDGVFYDQKTKKLIIINDLMEEIGFYERDCYQRYLKYYRSVLFSMVFDILRDNPSIKNIVCIGEEEGGNYMQLFMMDLINNRSEIAMELSEDLSYYLFTHNTAMLSTETFYKDLVSNLVKGNNSLITCFDDKNRAYDTWDLNDDKRGRYNVIVLNQ